jgi:hypothetical protein
MRIMKKLIIFGGILLASIQAFASSGVVTLAV